MTGPHGFPILDVECSHQRRARVAPADETRRAHPMERAFVVHLRPGTLPEEGRIAGRVEHVASGRSIHFGSLPELLTFLGRTVTNLREEVEQRSSAPRKRGEGTNVGPT